MKSKFLSFLIVFFSIFSLGFLQAEGNLQEIYKNFVEACRKISYDIPGRIELEGAQLSSFQFENGAKVVFCLPGQKVKARVNYQIDAEQLPPNPSHSLVVGLYPGEPQLCLIRSLGILDSIGIAEFSLIAPRNPGVYEVRCTYSKHLLFRNAKEDWSRWGNPSSETRMGVMIVQ